MMVNRRRGGFTLIELMIVAAIIGILAAIAIPNFVAMQLRSKRSELPTNVEGLRTCELAYFNQYDTFVDTGLAPPTYAAGAPQDFGDGGDLGFVTIGWKPDGRVYGQYEVVSNMASQPPGFDVTATADIDQDASSVSITGDRDTKPRDFLPNVNTF